MPVVFGQIVLAVHLAIIAFNVLGLVAIPVGAALGWSWVRIRWWRLLHVASWVVVAVQAVLGRACVLTLWQDDLAGGGADEPMVMRFVNGLIYWDLPMWVFTGLYLVLFALVLLLWRWTPPGPGPIAPAD